jgi:hypothetical protein
VGAAWTLGLSLHLAGMLALYQNRLQEARTLLEERVIRCSTAGENAFVWMSGLYLGQVALSEGKLDEARTRLEQSWERARQFGDQAASNRLPQQPGKPGAGLWLPRCGPGTLC